MKEYNEKRRLDEKTGLGLAFAWAKQKLLMKDRTRGHNRAQGTQSFKHILNVT